MGPSGPPAAFVANPKRIENTISGSIALRESSPTKSSAVKKFTISSLSDAYSPISSFGNVVHASRTGGNIFISTNIITAAIAPVIIKVSIVVPIIFPARRRLFIPATEPAIDANTSGTTTQNIIFINTVPRGFIAVPPLGLSQPNMHPATIAASITARNR